MGYERKQPMFAYMTGFNLSIAYSTPFSIGAAKQDRDAASFTTAFPFMNLTLGNFTKNLVFKRHRMMYNKSSRGGDILDTTEQAHQQDLERIKLFRYMDDDFMTVCLEDNFEGVELILQIVLGKKDIQIKSVRTQEVLKNLQGRSATLDVHASRYIR